MSSDQFRARHRQTYDDIDDAKLAAEVLRYHRFAVDLIPTAVDDDAVVFDVIPDEVALHVVPETRRHPSGHAIGDVEPHEDDYGYSRQEDDPYD